MLSMFRDHRPWGANVAVSNPNQFTPVRMTSRPFASTIFEPSARSGPFNGLPFGLAFESPFELALELPFELALELAVGSLTSGTPAIMSDRTTNTATTAGATAKATRPGRGRFRYLFWPDRGRFRYLLMSEASMILQKNRQQVSEAGTLTYTTMKSGVYRAADACYVVTAGQC